MADQVQFELVAPEQLLISDAVEMVVVPGAEGDFGVLPGHAPIISTIRTGVILVYENGAVSRRVFVSGGFAEVMPERCTVLAEEAVRSTMRIARLRNPGLRAAEQSAADVGVENASAQVLAELSLSRALLDAIDQAARG